VTGFGPFVVLLSEGDAAEADYGLAGGEDADPVGPPADFLVAADKGLLRQICRQIWR
jgi:hypothetical protein